MELLSKCIDGMKQRKAGMKFVTGLGVAFFMVITCNLTSYAFVDPHNMSEVEPNNTWETAQTTYPTNESAEKFAASDWSGRYSMYGTATSSDDDWYKVDLAPGEQYLSVAHSYGDNATYVEMFDSERNEIIPLKYGTRYNVIKFDSKGGTYYIHITGASEEENKYTLFVGTPMLSSNQVRVSFDSVKTSGTIRRSFSLKNEDILPKDAQVTKITLRDLPSLGYSGARVSSSSSSKSVSFNKTSLSGNIGSLGMQLKSDWLVEYYPKTTVTTIPIVDFFYFYPVYDNTTYPYLPTIKK